MRHGSIGDDGLKTNYFSSGSKIVKQALWRTLVYLDQGFWRRWCLKGYSTFSTGGNFVQRSRTINAILVLDIMWNISVKLL